MSQCAISITLMLHYLKCNLCIIVLKVFIIEFNLKSISYDRHAKVSMIMYLSSHMHINIVTYWALSHYCLIMNFYRADNNLLSKMFLLAIVRQLLMEAKLSWWKYLDDVYHSVGLTHSFVSNSGYSFVTNGHCNYCIEPWLTLGVSLMKLLWKFLMLVLGMNWSWCWYLVWIVWIELSKRKNL